MGPSIWFARRAAAGMLLLVLAASARADEVRADVKPRLPEVRIDASGFEAREADIRAVVESAGRELWRHFPDHRLEPIVVVKGDSGPITLFQRNERREIVVRLDTRGRHWCQYAYQFAHEFCHVLCDAKPGDRGTLWFEETLCETASCHVLRAMARSWRTDPPYPNWQDYQDSLRDYVDESMRRRPYVEEIVILGLPAFYAKHEAKLRDNPIDRDLNGSMAVMLLPTFEGEPARWEAVRWLNTNKTEAARSFDTCLADWHAAVPERHRFFVTRIAALFGRKIPVPQPSRP